MGKSRQSSTKHEGQSASNQPDTQNNSSETDTFHGELNTPDNRTLPLENNKYNSLEDFFYDSDEYFPGGFEQFKLHNATYLISDWTYSTEQKKILKKIADDYEKENPEHNQPISGISKRSKFLKQYDGMEYAPGFRLNALDLKKNFELELARRGYSYYGDNSVNKYYYENGVIYTALFNK